MNQTLNKLVECRPDSPPILVNLKSNTIMKKPHHKYRKDIDTCKNISIKYQKYFYCVNLIVVEGSIGVNQFLDTKEDVNASIQIKTND